VRGDAVASAPGWGDATKVIATFAVESIPDAWTKALPEGGRLVAPVGARDDQRLMLVRRDRGRLLSTEHGAVRYVPNRSGR
jgi:protein-L-isoaspartate(D-aspartate) O-methyltransferase